MPTNNHKLQNITFYILLAVVGVTVIFMFLPFFTLIALGGILAVLFTPLKQKLNKHVKSNTGSSIITLILAGLIILVPVYFVGQLVVNEIISVYQQTAHGLITFNQSDFYNHLPPTVQKFIQTNSASLGQKLSDVAGGAFQTLTSWAGNIASFIIGFILVTFTFYYFLRDGYKFRAFIEGVFPLSHSQEALLVNRLESAINGVVQGSFTVALLQGTVSTIGFFIFGVPQPLLWGLFTVMASLVPTVGTLLSLVPAILYLFLTGQTAAAIGMTIWAFISIQSIDNFISPRVIGHKTDLHPLVTLFSILGGISLFGYLGFLIGPILMAIFMSLLDLYVSGMKTSKK